MLLLKGILSNNFAQFKKNFNRMNRKFGPAEAYLILHGAESMEKIGQPNGKV